MLIKFDYNKKGALCRFCKRRDNPHPDFQETIPTKEFVSKRYRKIELCISCYEEMKNLEKTEKIPFEELIDHKEDLRLLFYKKSKQNN